MNIFKIIPRTIFWEFLRIFLVVLIGLTLFMILVGILYEAKDQVGQIPVANIPRLIPFLLPFALSMTCQLVLALTCCLVFTNLVYTFEIRILGLCGISPWRITYPVLFLAFLLSIASYFLADIHRKWGMDGMMKVVVSSAETIIYTSLEKENAAAFENSSKQPTVLFTAQDVRGKDIYALSGLSLNAGRRYFFSVNKARIFIGPANKIIGANENCIYISPIAGVPEYSQPGTPNISVLKYKPDPKDSRQILKIQGQGFRIQYGKFHANYQGTLTGIIPISHLDQLINQGNTPKPSDIPSADLEFYEKEYMYKIQRLKDELVLRSFNALLNNEMEVFSENYWNDKYTDINYLESLCRRTHMEPARRCAEAANCLSFTWIFIPLTFLLANRYKRLNIIYICVISLVILILLLIISHTIPDIAKKNTLPAWVFFSPHILCFFLGWWLRHKAFEYGYKGDD